MAQPRGRKNLFSQFLISGLRVFPAFPDPQRPQSRPGMALFCPLAYIPCPGRNGSGQSKATYQTLQGSSRLWLTICRSGDSSRTRLETARAEKGSLPGIRATLAQHTPHRAGGRESGVYCWPRDRRLLASRPLFSLVQGLVTRGTHKHSLSLGFRGCGPHGRLGHLEGAAPGAEAISTVTAAPPLLQH